MCVMFGVENDSFETLGGEHWITCTSIRHVFNFGSEISHLRLFLMEVVEFRNTMEKIGEKEQMIDIFWANFEASWKQFGQHWTIFAYLCRKTVYNLKSSRQSLARFLEEKKI